jgi:hypothetical protein
MKVAEYPLPVHIGDMQIAIGPILIFLGLAAIVVSLKGFIEWRLRPEGSFLGKWLLYPVEISLIPVINITADILGVPSIATDSIAGEITLVKVVIAIAAWGIWLIVLLTGIRVSLKGRIDRRVEDADTMGLLTLILILLYTVLGFGNPI